MPKFQISDALWPALLKLHQAPTPRSRPLLRSPVTLDANSSEDRVRKRTWLRFLPKLVLVNDHLSWQQEDHPFFSESNLRSNAEHLRSTHTDVAARFTEYGGLQYTGDWGATFPPKHGQALVYYSAATISKTNYLTRSTQHLSVSPQSERYQTVHRKTTSSIIDCARRRRRSVVPLRTMSSQDDVSAAIHTGNAHNEAITRRSPAQA